MRVARLDALEGVAAHSSRGGATPSRGGATTPRGRGAATPLCWDGHVPRLVAQAPALAIHELPLQVRRVLFGEDAPPAGLGFGFGFGLGLGLGLGLGFGFRLEDVRAPARHARR
eukprot:scaffold83047_cov32-Phaeocystis_antarctica.AAC.1